MCPLDERIWHHKENSPLNMGSAPDIDRNEDTASTTILLTAKLKRGLREVALIQGRSRNEIVREALTAYLGRIVELSSSETKL